ncbi:protein singed wings 2-like isoform X3 [Portunus trituberculatus]|uniref:protein singed wings 2-like isoform X2 n=1 Tax=Portunus trituberculatus TaxID=210409 RepID=UPI001E1CE6F6|nr:protein singed wings 2-like isoform X2 [Portunus trituberculatus]XP_045139356.1 protein singed wings 2-like isoform X3 [Portunus trituberculatus]
MLSRGRRQRHYGGGDGSLLERSVVASSVDGRSEKFVWQLQEGAVVAAASGAMSYCVCLWIILAAGTITVSGIKVKKESDIKEIQTACHTPQILEDSNLLHVECEGLASLQNVTTLLKKKMWRRLGSLTITNSNLITDVSLDDLVNYHVLHTLTFKESRLRDWKLSKMSSVPRVRKLVVEQCWDNDTFLAKEKELTLTISPKLQDAFPDVEELYLLDLFMPYIPELSGMKNLKKFVIDKGAAKCDPENLWLLEWYNVGKLEINSTLCFVADKTEDGLSSMNIIFTFVSINLMKGLRDIKTAIDDCPLACHCEINGYQRKTEPIAVVNCTSANWTQLPDLIPSHTRRLILTNNRITNISKVFTNPNYRSLSMIMLKNNLIDHIDGELLSNYLHNHSKDFSINLINNRLETLPVKHLERMYSDYTRNGHRFIPVFRLGGNPWNCDDCAFLVPFQNLIFYQDLQREKAKEIRCGEGRYAEGQPIIMLPVRSYCKVDPLLDPLDILNICLGILLLLFILNFLHNLVQYQRHGKLPWIVTRFPCC